MIAIGIDPGGKTGYCALNSDCDKVLDLRIFEERPKLLSHLQDLFKDLLPGILVVAIEDYLSAGPLTPDAKNALLIIGGVIALCEASSVPYFVRGAQERRPYLLKAEELIRALPENSRGPISPHKLDACAHALRQLKGA